MSVCCRVEALVLKFMKGKILNQAGNLLKKGCCDIKSSVTRFAREMRRCARPPGRPLPKCAILEQLGAKMHFYVSK